MVYQTCCDDNGAPELRTPDPGSDFPLLVLMLELFLLRTRTHTLFESLACGLHR
jgi:hypothetical protein